MENIELLYPTGKNVNWYSPCGKQYRDKTLRIELWYYPAIPLLGIYPNNIKAIMWKDMCTLMLTAALFTIAKIETSSKCPSMDEG